MAKPDLFFVSPAYTYNNESYERVGVAASNQWMDKNGDCVHSGHTGLYRGGASTLSDELKTWIRGCNSTHVMIIVSTHGIKGSGNFKDVNLATEKKFKWTPTSLWNVLNSSITTNLPKNVRKISIVMAQCYGALFSAVLESLVSLPIFSVVGLSKERTHRRKGTGKTVGEVNYHVELTQWLKKEYSLPIDMPEAPDAADEAIDGVDDDVDEGP
jgi:hypothetical protein